MSSSVAYLLLIATSFFLFETNGDSDDVLKSEALDILRRRSYEVRQVLE